MKGIFDTRAGTIYDDDVIAKYHFPNRYLKVAKSFVGDWILYREPHRNGGRSAYVAVAHVARVEPDPDRSGFSYARLNDYLEFDVAVPMSGPEGFFEENLRALTPAQRGPALQGRSVRRITPEAFGAIVRAGLDRTLAPENGRRLDLHPEHLDESTRRLVEAPPVEQQRRIEQVLSNRKIRDASFRRQVIDAYDGRCAVTGLRLVNGGGKAEAQAAHIWSVADGGPDVVRNGIALSGTVHWLFDRHLISLNDELGLLVAHNRVPAELRSLFALQMNRILLPANSAHHPHPAFVRRHRERFATI